MWQTEFEESGIEEIGDNVVFKEHADFSEQDKLKKIGNGVKFMRGVDLSLCLEEIGDNVVFAEDVSFFYLEDLKKIGNGVKFMGEVNFINSGIEDIPDDQPDWIKLQIEIQTNKREDIPDGTVLEKSFELEYMENLKKIGN
jgi:acetyltransferase-like isoleucine patch superfamily enzyme